MSAPNQRPAPSLLRSLLLLVTTSMSATRISPPGKQSSNRKQIRNCYKQLWVSRQFCEPLSCYGLHSGGRGRGTHTCDVRWLQTRAPLLSLASQGGVDGGFPALCCEERSFVGGIRSLSPESYRFSDSREQPLRTTVRTWPLCMNGMNISSEAWKEALVLETI